MRPTQDDPLEPAAALPMQPWWLRLFGLGAGALALVAGVIGIVVPLLPTTPLVLVAALRRNRVPMPTGADAATGCVSRRVAGA